MMVGTTPFGIQLRQHRVSAGLTQEELAERAGLSTDAISALERATRLARQLLVRSTRASRRESGSRHPVAAVARLTVTGCAG